MILKPTEKFGGFQIYKEKKQETTTVFCENTMLKHEEEVFCNFCRNQTEVPNDSASLFPENISLAMAYVPYQKWQNIYNVDNAFNAGTLFADLDKPFLGYGKGRRR